MRHIVITLGVLMFIASACKKTNTAADGSPTDKLKVQNTKQLTKFSARINDLPWSSEMVADTGNFLAARVADQPTTLMIKGYGRFLDGSNQLQADAIFINLHNVADTGKYALTFDSYIGYNTVEEKTPLFYSSQASNKGLVHISTLDADKVSGTFEFEGVTTDGSNKVIVKNGRFDNVYFLK